MKEQGAREKRTEPSKGDHGQCRDWGDHEDKDTDERKDEDKKHTNKRKSLMMYEIRHELIGAKILRKRTNYEHHEKQNVLTREKIIEKCQGSGEPRDYERYDG